MSAHGGDGGPWLRSVTKAVHRLMRTVVAEGGEAEDQASVQGLDWDRGLVNAFTVVIRPNGGLYQGGRFEFRIDVEDSTRPPIVSCITDIYHPNITTCDDSSPTKVCLNLVDDQIWRWQYGLESIVLGLIFLFHHPNIDAAISDNFHVIPYTMTQEKYEENVEHYMRVEEVDECMFDAQFFSNIDGKPLKEKQVASEDKSVKMQADLERIVTAVTDENDSECVTRSREQESSCDLLSNAALLALFDMDGDEDNALIFNLAATSL